VSAVPVQASLTRRGMIVGGGPGLERPG